MTAILKNLLFIIPYFALLFITTWRIHLLASDPYQILGFSITLLIELLIITSLILLVSLFLVLSITFSTTWKMIFPMILLSSVLILVTDPSLTTAIEAVVLFFFLSLYSLVIYRRLKTYITFSATTILSPSIKHVATFFILTFSIAFFSQSFMEVDTKGFVVPDSLVEESLKLTPQINSVEEGSNSLIPQISEEQIAILKKNPNLLKQSGIDPSILDKISSPQALATSKNPTREIAKAAVKSQFESMIKPYENLVPYIVAGIFFVTVQSFVSLLSIFLTPLLWALFSILEKTGFIKFIVEQRPVKKLVI